MAQGFASIKDRLPGTVMFLFQPAEENATGAKAMLADGAFERLKPDAIFAVHTAPFPVGQLVTAPGVLMGGRDCVRVTVERAPDRGRDGERGARSPPGAVDGHRTRRRWRRPPPDFVFVQARGGRAVGGGHHLRGRGLDHRWRVKRCARERTRR